MPNFNITSQESETATDIRHRNLILGIPNKTHNRNIISNPMRSRRINYEHDTESNGGSDKRRRSQLTLPETMEVASELN